MPGTVLSVKWALSHLADEELETREVDISKNTQ